MLAKAWNTKLLEIPDCMRAPFMSLIQLPKLKKYPPPKESENVVYMDHDDLITVLRDRFKICVPTFIIYGECWVRISAQIYNTLEDYEVLRDAIYTLMKEDEN
ncbi:unnamed protein product [Dimorphilus gyrociliatus]|uniref:Uncharacterized protein n=1 Tax=Dimorphilus gyrociliatus TaxID=2664684 RepID=A0A7I8VVQ1_9ANNE|nr:unnamed protein product [Dimorphilus gyrociliatus]